MSVSPRREMTGLGVFGTAYRRMFERWPCVPGSVDDVLSREMVLLTPETAPALYRPPARVRYRKGSRPELERFVAQAIAGASGEEGKVRGVAEALGRWHHDFEESPAATDYEGYRFGGTEESILARGSDNCADIARLACALYQVAGFPARLGFLADTQQAYCGHVICEVFSRDVWEAVDPETNVVYQHSDGQPASLWDLHRSAGLVERHSGPGRVYTNAGQFRAVAIAHYDIADSGRYHYTEVPLNDYVRAIWRMGDAGWPGGLRWLFAEDAGEESELDGARLTR
jgi:transglutaminase-like putative cysteine protease